MKQDLKFQIFCRKFRWVPFQRSWAYPPSRSYICAPMFRNRLIIVILILASALQACKQNIQTNDAEIAAFADDTKYSPEVVAASKALLDNKSDAALWYRRAFAFYAEKKFSDAERDINMALSLDDKNAQYYLLKARTAFELNKISEAYEAFEKAAKLNPNDPELLMEFGKARFILKEYDKAQTSFEKLIEVKGPNAPAYFYLGMIAKEKADTAGAVARFEAALQQDPDYYEPMVQLGGLYATRLDKRALDYFANALRVSPLSLEVLYARAMYYQDKKQYAEAIKDYESMIEISPLSRTPYYNIGYIYFQRENPDLAIKYFEEAMRIDEEYVEAIYMSGLSHEMKGDILTAIQRYQKCLEIAPAFTLAQEGLDRRRVKSDNVQIDKK